jgi:hypothetical protein
MYPGTKFNWYDNSWFSTTTAETELDNPPLILTAFSADKGTEEMIRIKGKDNFAKMYGTSLSFDKHGQVLLQAKNAIDAGAELLCKRVVASDATLSNAILTVEVSTSTVQRTDADGNPLYIDNVTGEETTDPVTNGVDNNPITETTTTLKWVKNTVENCKTFDEVMQAAKDMFINDANAVSYPLFVVTDIGRNADVKKVRIVPDYATSKSLGTMVYTVSEVEGTSVLETVIMTGNQSMVINDVSYAVNPYMMGELKIDMVPGVLDAYLQRLANATGMEASELKDLDFMFGCNLKGAALENVALDSSGIDLSTVYGILLESGSNGTEFGTTAYYASDAYAEALAGFFNGEDTDAIYDVDVHKISACVDANYPVMVKNAITDLAIFREDFFFFRDLGVGLNTYNSIVQAQAELTRTRFAGDYMTSYQVINPYTKRRINVTCMYDMVTAIINHLDSAPQAPYAGESNNFVLLNAIPGTLNYTPVNTPTVNQKDLLDDAHVNYATYYDYGGNLVVESLYTSQEGDSQLSYLNNVIAIQEVMRALRSSCPKNRFKFQNGNDFTEYEEACRTILQSYRNWFARLEFTYTQDDLRATQKIFYASIQFAFNNWVQSEVFDLYAIPTPTTTEQ